MKNGFRQSMAWLHTWTGLVAGWVLFFVFVTGTAGYFQHEITRWMQPERPSTEAPAVDDPATAAGRALDRLERVAPAAASWRITLPHEARTRQGFAIRWQDMPRDGHERGAGGSERLDPATGAVLPHDAEPRTTAGGYGLYRMHYALHYMPYDWAIRIVGVCTMLLLLAIVTGVVVHKKIFKDFFTFRPGKGHRSWLDAHNAVSVMALPFFLMITYSGLVFFLFVYMPAGRDLLYGADQAGRNAYQDALYERGEHRHLPIGRPAAPLAPLLAQAESAWGKGGVASIAIERHDGEPSTVVLSRVPGGVDFWNVPKLRFDADTGQPLPDEPRAGGAAVATHSVLLHLHEGMFVDIWGRWLYFVAGLLGCAMIGTGLVLWTVKRRRHHLSAGLEGREHFGVRLVEALNVATLAGLPLAVAAYFWANRLLPVELADRAAWELHGLFAAWLGSLFYALARPLRRAWVELSWAACAAYVLVPVINALTTDRHLGTTIPQGDWVLAGFDLTMCGLAALFALMAVKIERGLRPAGVPVPVPPADRPAVDGRSA
ncbi:MAG: PepSY domain-containing protein [Rhodocyclaceae bacterium]|nr:PepSY domain-containing protein [Rhodocyclaceae bacterium]